LAYWIHLANLSIRVKIIKIQIWLSKISKKILTQCQSQFLNKLIFCQCSFSPVFTVPLRDLESDCFSGKSFNMLTFKLPSRYTESWCSLLLHFCNLIVMEISFSPSSLLTTIPHSFLLSLFWSLYLLIDCPTLGKLVLSHAVHHLRLSIDSLWHLELSLPFFLPTFTLVCTIHVSPTGSLIPSWLFIGIRDNKWRELLTSRGFYLLTSRS
jgi:hypothetical protein